MQNVLQGSRYLWRLPATDHASVLDLAAAYNLSFGVAQTLVARGYATRESARSFLFSSLEADVADAALMKDAVKAVERIMLAIERKEKILIFGDYDVDGITSSAMMMACLLPLGAQVNFFLPHRVRDGYGLSTKVVERAADNGYTVIVTVDNGITAFAPADKARERGIDLIITDHHRAHDHVPAAYAIVNPNQEDCPYPHKSLAGVGVTFKVLSLLYARKNLTMPPKAYELLLLGTVADVVPLLGENRFWVRHGLHYVNTYESTSFRVLKSNGKITKNSLTSLDIGFSIAPQINALGRLEDARKGVQFLLGADVKQVEEVGAVLLELNQTRKEIERAIVADVQAMVAAGTIDVINDRIVIASSDSWPPGVIGLVASRIVGAYGRPTILLHRTKDGMAKGSCRSIAEFNMFKALQSAGHILEQFGGHAQAAGLSIRFDRLPELKAHLEKLASEQLSPFDLKQKIIVDAYVRLPDLTKKFITDMELLEPYGNSNSQPLFVIDGVSVIDKPTLLKDAHVKCQVFADGVIKPVIFFNRPELFAQLSHMAGQPFRLAAHVTQNHWQDKVTIELQGVDIAPIEVNS